MNVPCSAILEGHVRRGDAQDRGASGVEIFGKWREAPDPAHRGVVEEVRG